MNKEMVNEINLSDIKKCFPERAKLIPRRPSEGSRANGSYAIQVLCSPAMKDKEADYCMESVRQILPIKEFYSQSTGADIWIYWYFNKSLPITFNI